MNLPVVLTPEAQTEFDEAADWYEQQAGLGAAFTANVRENEHEAQTGVYNRSGIG
jgi:hypothetical protein